ncbi:MAG: HEPN domain-containing protein [Bacteroidales bacterium]|nr:HEPN domain-containing protein [Bacteroidales bacterium]
MSLTEEERKAIVVYRLEKAEDALVEAKDCASMGHWTLTANRLYYTAYYAASALLVSAGYSAKTHEGTVGMIGQNYVRTGSLTKEDGALLARLQSMRHTGDYDDFMDWTKEDVEPYIEKVESFLEKIKKLIYS